MKVWIVIEGKQDEDPYINGVFTSREGARARAQEIIDDGGKGTLLYDNENGLSFSFRTGNWVVVDVHGVAP